MADVKIVDIDGSQWSMKDQEARDKIVTLETEVNTNIPERFTVDEKRIDGVYRYAEGNSIQECCNKINFSYAQYDIAFTINNILTNPDSFPTGIYNLSSGGPAYLLIVQKLSNDFMSVIATGYSTPHILKAKKSDGIFALGVITPTIIVK